MPFKNNDFISLLFQDKGVSGRYSFSSWNVNPSNEKDPRIRRLVSLHESNHASLNEQTAYGSVLHCESFLNVNFPNNSTYKNRLEQLLNLCRKTHESYATYISILIVCHSKGGDIDKPENLLKNNYTYLDYYKTMKDLCSFFKGGYLQYHACVSIARVCMQSHLIKSYVKGDIKKLIISDFDVKDFPDERLRFLESKISNQFWSDIWKESRELFYPYEGFSDVLAHEKEPNKTELYDKAFNEKNDVLSTFIMKFFQLKLANLLNENGFKTLEYDGHKKLTTLCLNKINEIVPKGKSVMLLESAEDMNIDEVTDTMERYESEVYTIKEKKLNAQLLPLFDSERNIWLDPICDENKNPHYFIISRLLSRVLEQYNFDEPLDLEELNDEILYFFRRSKVVNGIRKVELFIINDPNQLNDFIDNYSNKLPIYSNLTMRTLSSEYHIQYWLELFQEKTFNTILFDLPPFQNFKAWKKQNLFDIFYNTIKLKIDNKIHFCFACKLTTSKDYLIITPCSLNTNQIIKTYISEIIDSERFIEDKAFLEAESEKIIFTLSHMIREESFFNFMATKKNK